MSSKPSLPKGTRDFGPVTMSKRNFIFENIKSVFKKYGFLPLETPAMENLSVLTGKYGEEGDKLLYKILNSGDFLSKASHEDLSNSKQLTTKIASKGLKYDLTVPFARYVAMNRHELALPFKRYQVQPVWRADRPQKGRYREFYQCDADVVGTKSLICEVEIISMINEVFELLGITEYEIKINHRKLLEGLCNSIGAGGKLIDLTTAIDKLDKIGWEGVTKELVVKSFTNSQIDELQSVIEIEGTNEEKVKSISELILDSSASEGINDVQEILQLLKQYGNTDSHLKLDLSLARGLSYYTGTIIEVKITNSSMGSVSGGGRYDDLTSVFGAESIPGVGFSFGVDRLYDAMEELELFPEEAIRSTQVLISHFDKESRDHGIEILTQLRQAGISSEIYPDIVKPKKQLSYANRKNIPFVLIIGSNEITSQLYTLKNMISGEETKLSAPDIINHLKH